jgi:ferredoxin-fold anticodon binding domain-containing protein
MEIKKYLPTKKFTKSMLIFIGSGILLFVLIQLIFGKTSFLSSGNKERKLATQKLTINELIQKDTDEDGIPDWEESLWGTDPNSKTTFGNTLDSEYIENKKKLLNLKNTAETENLTETDKFAREFFTTFTAMQASGEVDKETINNFSNAMGQKIIDPNLINIYTENDVKTDSQKSITKYYDEISSLFEKAKKAGIGEELLIISNNLTINPNENTMESNLTRIAEAYKTFAKDVINTKAPSTLSNYSLRIANNAYNTGVSVSNMSKTISDPIIGISGLAQYQKYSEDLISVAEELANAL